MGVVAAQAGLFLVLYRLVGEGLFLCHALVAGVAQFRSFVDELELVEFLIFLVVACVAFLLLQGLVDHGRGDLVGVTLLGQAGLARLEFLRRDAVLADQERRKHRQRRTDDRCRSHHPAAEARAGVGQSTRRERRLTAACRLRRIVRRCHRVSLCSVAYRRTHTRRTETCSIQRLCRSRNSTT